MLLPTGSLAESQLLPCNRINILPLRLIHLHKLLCRRHRAPAQLIRLNIPHLTYPNILNDGPYPAWWQFILHRLDLVDVALAELEAELVGLRVTNRLRFFASWDDVALEICGRAV